MKPSPNIAIILAVVSLAPPTFAAQLERGGIYTLPPTDARFGDLYFGGNSLRLDGRLEGSVLAGCQSANISGTVTRNAFLACQNCEISGSVTGDLNAFCATLSVTGPITGALRALAGIIYVNNRIGLDVLAGCQSLVIGPEAEVRGDVIAGCGSLELAGVVRGDVHASAEEIVITGTVDGDVTVTVGKRLILGDDARIFGSLRYVSDQKLDLGNKDAVFGSIIRVRPFPPQAESETAPEGRRRGLFPALPRLLTLLSILAALVTGFILLAVWHQPLTRALDRSLVPGDGHSAIRAWGRTVGFGALGFFATPVAALVSLAFIVTIPAALITLAGYIAAVYLAKVLTGLFVGRLLFRLFRAPNVSSWLATPVGIVIVYALCTIPKVGWLLWLFAVLIGFGIIVELLRLSRRATA